MAIYKSTGGSVADGTLWRNDGQGWERSHDGGETWRFSYSPEFYNAKLMQLDGEPVESNSEDEERELFGETLDEPIPNDLWDMIESLPDTIY